MGEIPTYWYQKSHSYARLWLLSSPPLNFAIIMLFHKKLTEYFLAKKICFHISGRNFCCFGAIVEDLILHIFSSPINDSVLEPFEYPCDLILVPTWEQYCSIPWEQI